MHNTAEKIDTTPLIDPAAYAAATDAIRKEAERLLTEGSVAAVIGYISGRRTGSAR